MQGVGVGRRAAAIIVDAILLMIVGWIIGKATGQATQDGFNLMGGPALLWFLVCFAYYVVMEAMWAGTVGKKALGLKVVKEDGSKLDWGASIIRNLLRIVDGFALYLIGAIVVWVSKKKQRLGDMAAHTLVVSKSETPAA
jgi:uncharacterized RDD family membrane protein YckC